MQKQTLTLDITFM